MLMNWFNNYIVYFSGLILLYSSLKIFFLSLLRLVQQKCHVQTNTKLYFVINLNCIYKYKYWTLFSICSNLIPSSSHNRPGSKFHTHIMLKGRKGFSNNPVGFQHFKLYHLSLFLGLIVFFTFWDLKAWSHTGIPGTMIC